MHFGGWARGNISALGLCNALGDIMISLAGLEMFSKEILF